MRLQIFASLLALMVVTSQEYSNYQLKYKHIDVKDNYFDSPKYNFDYKVKDDYHYTDFAHQESRDGEYTNGVYQVLLPDGRMQTVTYIADDYGYVADVKYNSEAKKMQNYVNPSYKKKLDIHETYDKQTKYRTQKTKPLYSVQYETSGAHLPYDKPKQLHAGQYENADVHLPYEKSKPFDKPKQLYAKQYETKYVQSPYEILKPQYKPKRLYAEQYETTDVNSQCEKRKAYDKPKQLYAGQYENADVHFPYERSKPYD